MTSSDEGEHEPTREISGRCAHCGRRFKSSVYSVIHGSGTVEETSTDYCGQRAECRRAGHEQYGHNPPITGASTAALGAAIIAGDYVKLPWWSRLLPNAAREELRYRFAKAMSAAVEHETRRRAGLAATPVADDAEDAGR